MSLISIKDEIRKTRDWSLGLLFLGCVVVLWVLSSFLLNDLFEQGTYSKPFFITWFNTAAFTLYLIPYYLSKKKKETDSPIDIEDEIPISEEESLVIQDQSLNLSPLTFKQTIEISFWFCLLWFISNFFNNASLIFTSVSSQTILSSTSSFFTIVIGYIFSLEVLNSTKLISLFMSFLGVLLVTMNDNPQTSIAPTFQSILIGNLLALSGALCYGIYSILLKWKLKDDSRVDMKLFFGFVGVFNTLLLWPSVVIVHYLGYEKFELPPNSKILSLLIFNCFISFLADFLWARAMLLTSPLTVTVGLCLTIPVAMIGDLLFKFKWNSPIYILGAVLVCVSFYFINKNEQEDSRRTD